MTREHLKLIVELRDRSLRRRVRSATSLEHVDRGYSRSTTLVTGKRLTSGAAMSAGFRVRDGRYRKEASITSLIAAAARSRCQCGCETVSTHWLTEEVEIRDVGRLWGKAAQVCLAQTDTSLLSARGMVGCEQSHSTRRWTGSVSP